MQLNLSNMAFSWQIVAGHYFHPRNLEKSNKCCSYRGVRSPSRALYLLLDDAFSLYYKTLEEFYKQKYRCNLTEMDNLDQVQMKTEIIEHYAHNAGFDFNLQRWFKLRDFSRFDAHCPIGHMYYLDKLSKLSINNRPPFIRTQQAPAWVDNRCFAG